jgi:DNA invertase Pin-like site-specific DNA recombinase
MTEPAIIYGRISTTFERQGRSIEAQDPLLRTYCQRRGVTIGVDDQDQPLTFADEVSGTIPMSKRPAGALVCRAIAQGLAKHLIITATDRLGRRAAQMIAFGEWCEKEGVALHIVCEFGELDYSSPGGRAMFQMLCVFAENQQRSIVSNIKRVLDHKRANNELCGTVPYGKRAVGTGQFKRRGDREIEIKLLEDDPQEQHWLRQMIAWREAGESYPGIARALNALNVPTKIPAGTPIKTNKGEPALSSGRWSQGNVQHVLHNSYTRALIEQLKAAKLAA